MLRKTILEIEDSQKFIKLMQCRGFRMLSGTGFKSEFERLGFIAPTRLRGEETGFIFRANGLTVIVWITWPADCQANSGSDSGWVAIKRIGDAVPLYYDGPFQSTQNLFSKLYQSAWLAKLRVTSRPICRKCRWEMEIRRGRKISAKYWVCRQSNLHSDKLPFFLEQGYDFAKQVKSFSVKKSKRKGQNDQVKKPENILSALLPLH